MKVSVIIPCYNQAQFLDESIQSAINQGIDDLEIIVVNDGSTDHTAQVAKKYSEIIYVEQENRGLANARNRGFAQSRGDFIVFLDSDDYLSPTALKSGLESLQNMPSAAFTYGAMQSFCIDGPIWLRKPHQTSKHYRDLLANNFIPTPGMVIFRRAALEKYGVFDQSVAASADYDIYLRISKDEAITCHPEIAVFRRFHPHAMTGNPGWMLKTVIKVLNRHRKTAISNQELKKYFYEGHTFWRTWYGNQVLTKLRLNVYTKNFREMIINLALLMRFRPIAIWHYLTQPAKSNNIVLKIVTGNEVGNNQKKEDIQHIKKRPDNKKGRILSLNPNCIDLNNLSSDIWNGKIVLNVTSSYANKGAQLFLNGNPIETIWKNPNSLVGIIPIDRLATPGDNEIYFIS